GRFEASSMPESLKEWLDMWRGIVEENRRTGAAPWQEDTATKAGGECLLETAQWSQGEPFNNKCLVIAGSHCQTGCTATSTAILMRYHGWPEKGVGTLPSYSYQDGEGTTHTIDAITLGHSYDWDQMPLKYTASWTAAQREQTATLLNDVAVMLKSEFGLEGTSAVLQNVIPGMTKYLYYDGAAFLDSKAMYANTSEWVRRLKENIDQVGPVIYSGQSGDSKASGHAFILDGYDAQDYFHVNWGWGGLDNGYFVIPEFQEYTRSHKALLGLKKYAGGKAPESIEIYTPGITTSETSFQKGKSFTVSFSILNSSSEIFNGQCAVAKFDRNGKLTELVSPSVDASGLLSNFYGTVTDLPCKITTDIHAGDYLTIVWCSATTPDWTAARYDHETTGLVGRIAVGDTVILEQCVSLTFDKTSGLLTVGFSCDADRELRDPDGKKVTTGVTDGNSSLKVDTRQLAPATYTLHLQRKEQTKDIKLKIGLKK
ncbi:MAG: C10 family peptidase, partial [Bacteroidales bacterium]|nr:C10 family peptidase [Bacteroidales bacterium]